MTPGSQPEPGSSLYGRSTAAPQLAQPFEPARSAFPFVFVAATLRRHRSSPPNAREARAHTQSESLPGASQSLKNSWEPILTPPGNVLRTTGAHHPRLNDLLS